jgi:hypothetical protein
MAIESAADFNSYLDVSTGHGVTGVFFEIQNNLWDNRTALIDTWVDIDSGNAYSINLIIDQEYFDIFPGTVSVNGYQPKAMIKSTDAPYISQGDKLLVNAITTNKNNVLKPATTFVIQNVQPDNTGLITLILEEE